MSASQKMLVERFQQQSDEEYQEFLAMSGFSSRIERGTENK
ncbi:MAG: hypothetical protein V7K97_29665 [Nostoc sp.]